MAVAFYVVIVATLSGLWRVAVDANGGDLAGYSAVALTWYIITSEAAIVSVNARHIEDIGNDIAQGTVAVEMLRPASVLGIRMATEVGRGLPKVAALCVAGGLVATIVVGRTAPARHAGPGGAEPGARHHRQPVRAARRGGHRLLDPRRRLDLVPLHEGGVHPRRDDHPARAAARRACSGSRCSCRSGRWPTRRRASPSGFWEPWLLVEQVFWIGVLAVGAAAAFRAGERRLQVVGG